MFKKILILCVGNICRSPMAEALLKNMTSTDLNITISSAGIAALVNYCADPMAQELMFKKGIDLSHHRAQQLTPKMLLESDLILTMEARQQQDVEYMLPSIRGRVHRLGKWSGFDIHDPYQRNKNVFEHALALIEQGIEDWRQKIWK